MSSGYKNAIMTFFTKYGPTPCDKNRCSEHQTLFPLFGEGLGTRLKETVCSLVPRPHPHVSGHKTKLSGEPSRISWAYYWNVVRTNEIAIFSYYIAP